MPETPEPAGMADSVNEQSPLLGKHQDTGAVGNAEERGTVGEPEGTNGDDTSSLPEEPSVRRLVLVLSSLWLGVFFAAAGK